jgi:hypothetical protein
MQIDKFIEKIKNNPKVPPQSCGISYYKGNPVMEFTSVRANYHLGIEGEPFTFIRSLLFDMRPNQNVHYISISCRSTYLHFKKSNSVNDFKNYLKWIIDYRCKNYDDDALKKYKGVLYKAILLYSKNTQLMEFCRYIYNFMMCNNSASYIDYANKNGSDYIQLMFLFRNGKCIFKTTPIGSESFIKELSPKNNIEIRRYLAVRLIYSYFNNVKIEFKDIDNYSKLIFSKLYESDVEVNRLFEIFDVFYSSYSELRKIITLIHSLQINITKLENEGSQISTEIYEEIKKDNFSRYYSRTLYDVLPLFDKILDECEIKIDYAYDELRIKVEIQNTTNNKKIKLESSKIWRKYKNEIPFRKMEYFSLLRGSKRHDLYSLWVNTWNKDNPLWKINVVVNKNLNFPEFIYAIKLMYIHKKLTKIVNYFGFVEGCNIITFATCNNYNKYNYYNRHKNSNVREIGFQKGFNVEGDSPRKILLNSSNLALKYVKQLSKYYTQSPIKYNAHILYEFDYLIKYGFSKEFLFKLKEPIDLTAFYKIVTGELSETSLFKQTSRKKKINWFINLVKHINKSSKHTNIERYYLDYLRMCDLLDINPMWIKPTEKISGVGYKIIFYHDEITKIYNLNKGKLNDIGVLKVFNQNKILHQVSCKDLILLLPKTGKEIFEEGQNQNHCVGSYIDKVAQGKCIIAFLRRTNARNIPLYTIEIIKMDNGYYEVFQKSGRFNSSLPKKDEIILEKIIEDINSKVPSNETLNI